jgi:hypothetical protein
MQEKHSAHKHIIGVNKYIIIINNLYVYTIEYHLSVSLNVSEI